MIKYKKVYCTFFGYDVGDSIKCEVCVYDVHRPFSEVSVIREAVDIHHLTPRGMGGSKCCNINEVPNLIALCREHNIEAESCKETNKFYRIIHLKNMIKRYEEDQINKIKW